MERLFLDISGKMNKNLMVMLFTLTILTGKAVLLDLVKKIIEIEAWLLLPFFPCLHNHN